MCCKSCIVNYLWYHPALTNFQLRLQKPSCLKVMLEEPIVTDGEMVIDAFY